MDKIIILFFLEDKDIDRYEFINYIVKLHYFRIKLQTI